MKTELDICKGILSIIVREFDLNSNSAENKQRATKTIYTLQAGGMNMGYGFGWYKNGPYSQDISDDLYEVLSHPEYDETKDKDKWNFSEDSWERINDIKDKFIDGKSLRDLELMISMHFMYTVWRDEQSPHEMKQWFRRKHANKTFGDESLISEEQLQRGLVDACNLIAYKNYHENGER